MASKEDLPKVQPSLSRPQVAQGSTSDPEAPSSVVKTLPVTDEKRLCDCGSLFSEYFRKWKGKGEGIFPPMPTLEIVVWSFLSCFIGLSLVSFILAVLAPTYPFSVFEAKAGKEILSLIMTIYASSALLVFGMVDSPEAQPRNLIFGNLICVSVGFTVVQVFNQFGYNYPLSSPFVWLQLALSVSLSLSAMQVTRTFHSPGGSSTALVVLLHPTFKEYGILFVVCVMAGAFLLLLCSLLINNVSRQYPSYWWKPRVAAQIITEELGDGEEGKFQMFGEAFQIGKVTNNKRANEDFIQMNIPSPQQ